MNLSDEELVDLHESVSESIDAMAEEQGEENEERSNRYMLLMTKLKEEMDRRQIDPRAKVL